MMDRDIDQLDRLLADDFVAVHIDGYEQPEADRLAQIRSGRMTYHDAQEVSASVEPDAETAILTARNSATATIDGAEGTWPSESTTEHARVDGYRLAIGHVLKGSPPERFGSRHSAHRFSVPAHSGHR